MSTPAWPSSLDDVLVSGYSVKEPGLIGWWSNNTLPAYPDNVAGTTYINPVGWTTGVDGWAALNGTVTIDNAKLKALGNGASLTVRVYRAVDSRTKNLVIKLDYDANISGFAYYNGSGTTSVTGIHTGNYYYINVPIVSTEATYTYFDINFPSTTLQGSTNLYIHYIYIGTGLYDSPLLDNSGAVSGIGNLISYGSVPVTGLSGNAIFRNGVNSYERSSTVVSSVPDVWHYHESFPFGFAVQTNYQSLLNYKAQSSTTGFLWIVRQNGGNDLYVQYCNGTSFSTTTVSGYFSGYTSTRIDVDVEINWAQSTATIWRNGSLVQQSSLITPVKPIVGEYLYFGSYQGTTYFCCGISDEQRAYNSSLLSQEVADIYARNTSYEALPSAPLNSSYSDTTISGVLRSSMDVGIAKQRRRYTAEVRTLAAQFFLDKYQKQILEQFYDDTLVGGTLDFTWTEPITGEAIVCRFPGKRPAFSALEYGFIASCEFEIIP